MADEVSNKTIAILVAVVLVISVVGTWTILSQGTEEDLSWYNPSPHGTDHGKVKLWVGGPTEAGTQVAGGEVGLIKSK